MTMTTEERLAALKARQGNRRPARSAGPTPPIPSPAMSVATMTGPVAQPPAVEVPSAFSLPDRLPVPADPATDTIRMSATSVVAEPVGRVSVLSDAVSGTAYRPRPASSRTASYTVPWERVSAGGAAVVSFVSMIVAMGPLFKGADAAVATVADSGAAPTGESAVAGTAAVINPVAPVVDIQVPSVDPAATAVDPTAAQADASATPVEMVPATDVTAGQAAAAQTEAQASATQAQAQAPATQPPATQAQAPATQPPATAAPTSQAPATQAPTTQPPTTAAPTTPPPATEPPTTATTAPPRSEGSGG
ncbi:MAG: hypothetical protein OES24_20385 [Acidimicrobiia bacterium]|nr:hypothetical protein [Acidimicrobiia bacterium]